MQCPSQDLGLRMVESGLRRILQDCRTFGGPGEVLWGFDCTDCKDYGTYSVYFFLELSQFSNTEQKDMR